MTTKARQQRDYKDTDELITFLSQRNPFNHDPSLRSITSGVVAEDDVNANKAKEVGMKTLSLMVGKNVYNYSLRRKDKLHSMYRFTFILLKFIKFPHLFKGRFQATVLLNKQKTKGCYAGVEDCCKICRRHQSSGPTAVVSETQYLCNRRSVRGP